MRKSFCLNSIASSKQINGSPLSIKESLYVSIVGIGWARRIDTRLRFNPNRRFTAVVNIMRMMLTVIISSMNVGEGYGCASFSSLSCLRGSVVCMYPLLFLKLSRCTLLANLSISMLLSPCMMESLAKRCVHFMGVVRDGTLCLFELTK